MFTGKLLEHQIGPCNKLCARKQLLLGAPQGTGKTIMALASAEKLVELNYINKILVLAPQGVAWQWLDRIAEFTDHENVTLVESKNKRSREYGTYESLYTIVPWSVFRKDASSLLRLRFDLVISDEAQEFSNFRSATHKAIRRFKTPYRWALTGTSISNKLEELYAILQWIDPYFLPPWPTFAKRHLRTNPNTNQILGYKNLTSLNKYLEKRVCIIDKPNGMPNVIPHRIYVEKDDDVKRTELDLRSAISSTSSSTSIFSFDADISRALHAARQALVGSTKLEACYKLVRRILDEDPNNKVVIYSFYKDPIRYLSLRFGNQASLFTGDDDASAKRAATVEFREGEARVLLCSDAGKAGLDLPFANYTIHLDVPFSHGTNDQRSTRTERVGSKFSSVVVIYLLVRDSIECYYYQVTNNKGKLAKATLYGGLDTITMREQTLKEYLDDVIERH